MTEGLRALREGKIGAALDAWEAALSLDPDNEEAAAFRDYIKQNRIRIAVHIGRQPPTQDGPLELPKAWPPPPAGLCDPPGAQLRPPSSPELAASGEDTPYAEMEIAPDEDAAGDTSEEQAAEMEGASHPVLEIVLDDEHDESSPAPPLTRRAAEPMGAFAEDAPTILRDPTGTAPVGAAPAGSTPMCGSPSELTPGDSDAARPSETLDLFPSGPSPRGMSSGASPRGTLAGFGQSNPFAGGLKASFGPGIPQGAPGSATSNSPGASRGRFSGASGPASPSGRITPTQHPGSTASKEEDPLDFRGRESAGEASFDDELPTRLRRETTPKPPDELLGRITPSWPAPALAPGAFSEDLSARPPPSAPRATAPRGRGAPQPDDFDAGEASFGDDLPTRTRDRYLGTRTPACSQPSYGADPHEPSFAEDQVTIARLPEQPAPPDQSASALDEALDDPLRGLSMARLLYDEGAFEQSLDLLDRLETSFGDLPGGAELREQTQSAQMALMRERLGPTDALAVPRASAGKLSDLDLDPRAAFLFSRIDGTLSIEDLLDISGMSRDETTRLLLRLRELGLLSFEPRR